MGLFEQVQFRHRDEVLRALKDFPGYRITLVVPEPDRYLSKGKMFDGGVTVTFLYNEKEFVLTVEGETRKVVRRIDPEPPAFEDCPEEEYEAELDNCLGRRTSGKNQKPPRHPKDIHYDGSGAPLWEAQEFSFGTQNGRTARIQCFECHGWFPESDTVFGSTSILKASENYCKDCGKALKIIDFDELTGPQFSFGY